MDTGFPDAQEGKQSQQSYWDLNKVSNGEAAIRRPIVLSQTDFAASVVDMMPLL